MVTAGCPVLLQGTAQYCLRESEVLVIWSGINGRETQGANQDEMYWMTGPETLSRKATHTSAFFRHLACSTVRRPVPWLCVQTPHPRDSLCPNNSNCLERSFSYLLFINFSQYFYTEKIVIEDTLYAVDKRNSVMVGDYFYMYMPTLLLLWKDKCFNKKIYIPWCGGHFFF